MVVVWVGLPVGVAVGYHVDAVSSCLYSGFAVLKVEISESGEAELARFPGRLGCEPGKWSSECIKRLAKFPLQS